MVTDLQVRRLFDMRNKHEYLYQAADAAGISSKMLIRLKQPRRSPQLLQKGFQKNSGENTYTRYGGGFGAYIARAVLLRDSCCPPP